MATSGYVDKMVSKAGLEYDIQDARILPTSAAVANQVVKVNSDGTGLEYGVVDVSGAINTHDTNESAHSYIRGLISSEATTRESADNTLGNRIGVFEAGGAHDVAALETSVATIEGKIPSEASSSNKLADKEFVNSSIATNTATFRGTSAKNLTEAQFLAWANGLTKTKNDYVFWDTVDTDGNTIFKRYKYDGTNWVYEYTLNNSSFTASQWSTINSGLTSSDKTKLDGIEDGANNYVHPAGSGASQASGLYKFSTDATSHISGVSAVAKSDITALGIPAQDTTYSEATTSTSGLMSASDKTKLNGIVAASSVTFTLPAISAGGTANVTVSGITANTVGVFGLASTATAAQYAAAAASQLQLTAQTTNQVTIRANGDALAAGVPAVINILG